MIKDNVSAEAKDVEIKWTDQRGVMYKGDFLFKQPKGDSLGDFCGVMEGLELAERDQ